MKPWAKCLSLVMILAVAACGDSEGDNGQNQYILLSNYSRLQIIRPIGSNSTYPSNSSVTLFINLTAGSISTSVHGTIETSNGIVPFTCPLSTATLQYIYDNLDNVLLYEKPAGAAPCPLIMPSQYEILEGNSTNILVDDCKYSYAGNGAQIIDSIYNRIMSQCSI